MAYRDEQRCHLCGELTRVSCPACENPVCAAHTLAGRLEGASAAKRSGAERLARRLGGLDACQRCVERELEASQGPFVEILRSGDPIQTQMVVEALVDEGFDARSIGTQNAALLGAGQHIFEQRVEVPQPQAEAALALVADLESGVPLADVDSAGEVGPEAEGDEEEGGGGVSPRRRGIAAGLAFIFPGASHYYAQHPWTGMLLTAAFVLGVLYAAQGFVVTGAVMMVGTPLFDLVTGQLAVSAHNRGEARSVAVQLAQGAVMGGLLLGLGRLAELGR